MLAKFKENIKEAADLRMGFQEMLEEGFKYGDESVAFHIPTINENGIEEFDAVNDHVVYDLARSPEDDSMP